MVKLLPLRYGFGIQAIVDDDDYEELNYFNWEFRGMTIVRQYSFNGKGKIMSLASHVFKGDIPDGCVIDHINRNPTDNRKENLRVATRSENGYNTGPWNPRTMKKYSGYKGVGTNRDLWTARIFFKSRFFNVGTYQNEMEAAAAYDYAARKLFKEFAYTNFPGLVVDSWPEIDAVLSAPAKTVVEASLTRIKRKGCTSRFKGVTKRKNRFFATIATPGVQGKPRYLGCFKTDSEAYAAYCRAFFQMYGFEPQNAERPEPSVQPT